MGKSKQKSMLIIVCERDIDVDFYSSYEEAYNAMLHDISGITQIPTEELEHFEKDFMEFIRITKRTKQKHGQMLQTETNGIGKLFRFNNRGFYGKRIVFKRVLPRMESN